MDSAAEHLDLPVVRVPYRPVDISEAVAALLIEIFGPGTDLGGLKPKEVVEYYDTCLRIDGGQRWCEWLALLIECDRGLNPPHDPEHDPAVDGPRIDPDVERMERKRAVRRRLRQEGLASQTDKL